MHSQDAFSQQTLSPWNKQINTDHTTGSSKHHHRDSGATFPINRDHWGQREFTHCPQASWRPFAHTPLVPLSCLGSPLTLAPPPSLFLHPPPSPQPQMLESVQVGSLNTSTSPHLPQWVTSCSSCMFLSESLWTCWPTCQKTGLPGWLRLMQWPHIFSLCFMLPNFNLQAWVHPWC